MDIKWEELELKGNFLSAEDLGIREDQRCALIKTLAFIEAGKTLHTKSREDVIADGTAGQLYFNMQYWTERTNCGTICCLGGTAETLSGPDENGKRLFFDETQMFAGRTEISKLFGTDGRWRKMRDVTEKQGAQALRNYLTTGKSNWDQVLGKSS